MHDIWHVLFDVPTTVQGELALKVRRWAHLSQIQRLCSHTRLTLSFMHRKALEFFQTGAPSSALAALVAPARLPPKERAYLFHGKFSHLPHSSD